VLDLGCGPGSNTQWFLHADYVGLDLEPAYIENARKAWPKRFEVADVSQPLPSDLGEFDLILVNSLLHHLSDEQVRKLFVNLQSRLTDDGFIHVIDLTLPPRKGLPYYLARWDRGEYARPAGELESLVTADYEAVLVEPFKLKLAGATGWEMLYLKLRRPTSRPAPSNANPTTPDASGR
ncbi:MAG TPA: class I SAM-dependent methyltransferase, partial [Pirellulales bacterium]